MLPSDIHVSRMHSLADTFGHAEAEQFAMIMVLALADAGDEWRPISIRDIADFMQRSPLIGEFKWNPLYRPSLGDLYARGFVVVSSTSDTVEFTGAALSILSTRARHPRFATSQASLARIGLT